MPVHASIFPEAFGTRSIDLELPDGLTITEHLGEAADTDGLRIHLEGHEVMPGVWHCVRPKPGTRVTAIVPIRGGGQKSKNPLATIAALAVAAAAIAATGGAAGGILGPAFGAQTLGAALLGAGIGIVGNLAIALLFPAPTIKGPRLEEGENFQARSISGNRLETGGVLPRIIGTHLVTPPLGAPPVTRIVDREEELRAFFVLAGPHRIDEVRVNGANVDEVDDVDVEIREGWETDTPLTLVTEQNVQQPHNKELSDFKFDPNAQTLFDQADPASASPRWDRFMARKAADQIDIRLNFIAVLATGAPNDDIIIPFRIRMRQRGMTAWRNLPQVHFNGNIPSVGARELRIKWGTPPSSGHWVQGTGGIVDSFDEYHFTVGPPSVSITTLTNTGWQADATIAETDMFVDYDGMTIYLDEADWPRDQAYEIEIKRGLTTNGAWTVNQNGTLLSGTSYDWFEPYDTGSEWRTPEQQRGRDEKIIVTDVISRWYEHPMPKCGVAAIAIRSRGINVQSVAVLGGGYVRDWNGQTWSDWKVTSNPAPHYRDVLVGELNANPLGASQIDETTLIKWRTECAIQGYRCDMLAGDDNVADTLQKVAACGFAVPRQGDTWAVAYERDRSNEVPRQVFTPRNSRAYSFRKGFELQPAGIKTRFFDREQDYLEREIVTPNPQSVRKWFSVEGIDYPGLTSEAAVDKRARFDLAQITYRGVEHSIEIPVEYLMARKGDLVGFETDVLDRHLDVREITAVNGNQITLNDTIDLIDEDGVLQQTDILAVPDFLALGQTSYAAIVNATGVSVRKITAWNAGSKTATLETAPSAASSGDRFILGLGETVYRRMLIRSIEPLADLEARLTLVDEAPEVVATLQ